MATLAKEQDEDVIADVGAAVEAFIADDGAPLHQIESLCMRCGENVSELNPFLPSLPTTSLACVVILLGEHMALFWLVSRVYRITLFLRGKIIILEPKNWNPSFGFGAKELN